MLLISLQKRKKKKKKEIINLQSCTLLGFHAFNFTTEKKKEKKKEIINLQSCTEDWVVKTIN